MISLRSQRSSYVLWSTVCVVIVRAWLRSAPVSEVGVGLASASLQLVGNVFNPRLPPDAESQRKLLEALSEGWLFLFSIRSTPPRRGFYTKSFWSMTLREHWRESQSVCVCVCARERDIKHAHLYTQYRHVCMCQCVYLCVFAHNLAPTSDWELSGAISPRRRTHPARPQGRKGPDVNMSPEHPQRSEGPFCLH